MIFRRFSYNFLIALDAIGENRLRSLLTSLGIIFGVASVITMLAIGRGAQQEIMQQMELLGVNNIIINPIVEQEEGNIEDEEEREPQRFTPGLTVADAQSINELPFVTNVSPEIVLETLTVRQGRKRSTKMVGVTNNFFEDEGFQLAEGDIFSQEHHEFGQAVCIIGYEVKTRFFPTEEALGKKVKCGSLWLTVIGIMQPRNISSETRSELSKLGIRNYDLDIYVPMRTVLLRYRDRTRINRAILERAAQEREEQEDSGIEPPNNVNYHQLDKLVVRVSDTKWMTPLAEISTRMLTRRHNNVVDFEVTVPELLLAQKRRTTAIFNFVLGAIASISLIVGGIGIMNIMLASVLERIKEIGLRLSLGATQRDIILQFMSEAVAISVSGGVVGIILGLVLSYLVRYVADIQTIISPWSVLLSFAVAVSVGLVFGIYPARRAAAQDPVVSLRSS